MNNTQTITKVHNFSAGPSILFPQAYQDAIDAINNFAGTGLSLLEVSHRGKEFEKVMDDSRAIVKRLLNIPDSYEVIFLGGGASLQFCMVAYNLLENKAAYTKTGVWASNAIKEAKAFGQVDVIASSEDKNFCYIPKDYSIPSDADYFHCTSNNTIYGTQMHQFPQCNIPMVCDMSSDIFSRPFDINKFSLIYAGAQKNMGPAGVTMVIIKKEILGKVSRHIPTMLDYRVHIDKESMFNTPPVFPIYVSLKNLEHVENMGGVVAMENRNRAKMELLYNEIDNNDYFEGTVAKEDRSWMNVCFVMKNKEWEDKFSLMAKEAKISGIKGHRSVGGFRASLYNALPIDSVQVLVDTMRAFKP